MPIVPGFAGGLALSRTNHTRGTAHDPNKTRVRSAVDPKAACLHEQVKALAAVDAAPFGTALVVPFMRPVLLRVGRPPSAGGQTTPGQAKLAERLDGSALRASGR